jgi:plasmid stabilization system protein ParE
VEGERKIIWNHTALETLSKALQWISQESIQGAETVENGIIRKLNQASINPYRFPPDGLKINNSGDFRFFITHSYRITYRIAKTEIRVLRIRHIKQKPISYQ